MSSERRDTLLCALALAVLVLAVFAPSLSAALVNWDDEPGIARNHAFRGLDGAALRWMFTTHTLGHFQPLSWLSLSIDHALWGLARGLDAPQAGRWHATSVALHLAVTLAFLGLARDVLALALPRAGARARLVAAGVAAALFAVHPLRAESVAWLTERRDVLSGLFLVLAVRAALRAVRSEPAPGVARTGTALAALAAAAIAAALALAALDLAAEPGLALREHGAALLAAAALAWVASAALGARATGLRARGAFAAACALALLSLCAKAWGIVLPALLLVLDLTLLGRIETPARARRGARVLALVGEKAPFVALGIVFARLAGWAQASEPGTMAGLGSHTLLERLTQAAYGLVWYPWKTLAPSGLVAFVELPAQVRASEPRFALALALVAAAVLALALLRDRARPALAAALAYAVLVSPVLGLAQSGAQLVADRYSYLAGLPLVLLVCGGGLALALRRPGSARALVAIAVLAIFALAFAGQRQVRVWRDSRTLWSHALAVDPRNGFAAAKLAQALVLEGQPDAAELERAEQLLRDAPRPADPVWHASVAQTQLALARARPAERAARLAQALAAAGRVLELQAGRVEPESRLVLGTVLLESNRAAEAVPQFEAFVAARPAESVGWTNLGAALAAESRFGEAVAALERALALEPDYAKAWQFLAQARERTGDRAGAVAAWRRVLALWPQSAQARAHLAALGAPP
jgi:tetratricopeptide (TPR) repeat protein